MPEYPAKMKIQLHFAQIGQAMGSDLYADIQISKKLLTKGFAWIIIQPKYIIIRHLIEVADMISTLLHTTASGGRGKAVPPKRFCGCRRRVVGIVFKRHGTVTFMWRAINGF